MKYCIGIKNGCRGRYSRRNIQQFEDIEVRKIQRVASEKTRKRQNISEGKIQFQANNTEVQNSESSACESGKV